MRGQRKLTRKWDGGWVLLRGGCVHSHKLRTQHEHIRTTNTSTHQSDRRYGHPGVCGAVCIYQSDRRYGHPGMCMILLVYTNRTADTALFMYAYYARHDLGVMRVCSCRNATRILAPLGQPVNDKSRITCVHLADNTITMMMTQ